MTKLEFETGLRALVLVLVSIAITACDRPTDEVKSSALIKLNLAQSPSNSNSSLGTGSVLTKLILNISSTDGMVPVFWSWDSNSGTPPPTTLTLDVANGSSQRLFQAIAVYSDTTGAGDFYYGETGKLLTKANEDVAISLKVIKSNIAIRGGNISGRFLTGTNQGPSGDVIIEYLDPSATRPIEVERGLIVSGWFQLFGLESVPLNYRLTDNTVIFNQLQLDTIAPSSSVVAIHFPQHYEYTWDSVAQLSLFYTVPSRVSYFGFWGAASGKQICVDSSMSYGLPGESILSWGKYYAPSYNFPLIAKYYSNVPATIQNYEISFIGGIADTASTCIAGSEYLDFLNLHIETVVNYGSSELGASNGFSLGGKIFRTPSAWDSHNFEITNTKGVASGTSVLNHVELLPGSGGGSGFDHYSVFQTLSPNMMVSGTFQNQFDCNTISQNGTLIESGPIVNDQIVFNYVSADGFSAMGSNAYSYSYAYCPQIKGQYYKNTGFYIQSYQLPVAAESATFGAFPYYNLSVNTCIPFNINLSGHYPYSSGSTNTNLRVINTLGNVDVTVTDTSGVSPGTLFRDSSCTSMGSAAITLNFSPTDNQLTAYLKAPSATTVNLLLSSTTTGMTVDTSQRSVTVYDLTSYTATSLDLGKGTGMITAGSSTYTSQITIPKGSCQSYSARLRTSSNDVIASTNEVVNLSFRHLDKLTTLSGSGLQIVDNCVSQNIISSSLTIAAGTSAANFSILNPNGATDFIMMGTLTSDPNKFFVVLASPSIKFDHIDITSSGTNEISLVVADQTCIPVEATLRNSDGSSYVIPSNEIIDLNLNTSTPPSGVSGGVYIYSDSGCTLGASTYLQTKMSAGGTQTVGYIKSYSPGINWITSNSTFGGVNQYTTGGHLSIIGN